MGRSRLFGAVLFASALVLTGCGSGAASGGGNTDDPIKIGLVLPLTGSQAQIAKIQVLGAQTAVDEINEKGGVLGRRLELVQKDDELSAAKSATVARELESEGVELVIGGETTDLCKSLAEATSRLDMALFAPHCTNASLTNPLIAPNFWHLAASNEDMSRAEGKFLAQKYPGIATWDVFGYDTQVTRLYWDQVAATMKTQLGRPIGTGQVFFVPLDQTSYKNQLTAQSAGYNGDRDSRGLFLSTFGAGTTNFVQQARPLGLLDQYAAIGNVGSYWLTVKTLADGAPPVYNAHEYFWSCQQNPLNDSFIKRFEALSGQKPETSAYQEYNAVRMIAAAVQKANSAGADEVKNAVPGLSIETPAGVSLTMPTDSHHASQPITVARLARDANAPEGIGVTDCHTSLPKDL